jgi:hypothetical protein
MFLAFAIAVIDVNDSIQNHVHSNARFSFAKDVFARRVIAQMAEASNFFETSVRDISEHGCALQAHFHCVFR